MAVRPLGQLQPHRLAGLALVAQPERLREHSAWTGTAPVVRLHVGLEDPGDLIADLEHAFSVTSDRALLAA
jgi:cystathionine beta-lyase